MTTAEEKPIGSKGFYIGIDPDVDRNGVAFLDIESRMLDIQCLPFPQTLEYLQQARDYAAENHTPYKVIIEAGWMNKGNWHLNHWDGRIASAAREWIKAATNRRAACSERCAPTTGSHTSTRGRSPSAGQERTGR